MTRYVAVVGAGRATPQQEPATDEQYDEEHGHGGEDAATVQRDVRHDADGDNAAVTCL